MFFNSFPEKLRNKKWYLLLSTIALMCLSLTYYWHSTISLCMIWILCYIITVFFPRRDKLSPPPPTHTQHASPYLAAFGLILLSSTFYFDLSRGRPLEVLTELGIPASVIPPVVLLLAILGSLVGYHAMSIYVQYLICLLIPVADIVKKMYKQYFTLSAIYVCSLLALIRANFYYIDDLGRGVLGYSLVGNFSRYAAHALSMLIHGNGYLSDISPLPQILAALIMALAAVITLYVLSDRTDFNFMGIVCMIPFGIFPYFLECLSYKYDAPYMALSVLAAVFPLVLYKQHSLKYIIASALGTVIVCTTYQTSVGVFPMCVALLCFMKWNNGENIRDTFSFLYKSMIGFCSGILFFLLIMMTPISESFYVSSSVDLHVFPANMGEFINRILGDFNLIWLLLILVILVSFIIIGCISSKRKKNIALLMCILVIHILFVFSYSLNSFLSKPATAPRAMYGFGILLSLLAYYIIANSKALIPRITTLLLAWFVFVFTFTYGNALHSQNDYADFRITQALTDLSHQDVMDTTDLVYYAVTGTIGFSEGVQNMLPTYPILEDLVQVQFADNTFAWNAYRLQHYYGITNLYRTSAHSLPAPSEMTVLVDFAYHSIYQYENKILIELK